MAKHGPRAEEITAHMKEIAKLVGDVADLSPEWESMNKAILTDDMPLSQEMQAVQVSCSRGFRKLQTENAALLARNAELEQIAKTGNAMLSLETAGEEERAERRDLKARGRNTAAASGLMQKDTNVVRNIPDWAARFVDPSIAHGSYVPPTQRTETRGVTARLSEPAAAPITRLAPVQQQQQPKQLESVQQQQQQISRPLRPGMPDYSNSMRNNPQNKELWNFLYDVTGNTDFTKGALATIAGVDMRRPQEGSRK